MFRHLITESPPPQKEIDRLLKRGYEWLHDSLPDPGNDLNGIMQRLPLVVVLPNPARKTRKVRFIHIFYVEEKPRFLQISCGLFPENYAGAIVMDLDPEPEPRVDPVVKFPCPLSKLVLEAIECLSSLCRTPGRGKSPPSHAFLLLLISVSDPNALAELHAQYVAGGGTPMIDEARLAQTIELFAEKRETVRRDIAMAGIKIRHLIRSNGEFLMRLEGAAEACMYRAMMEEWKIRGK